MATGGRAIQAVRSQSTAQDAQGVADLEKCLCSKHSAVLASLAELRGVCEAKRACVAEQQQAQDTAAVEVAAYPHSALAREAGLGVDLADIGRLPVAAAPAALVQACATLRDAASLPPRAGLEGLHAVCTSVADAFLVVADESHLDLTESASLLQQLVAKCTRIPTKSEVLDREEQQIAELTQQAQQLPVEEYDPTPHTPLHATPPPPPHSCLSLPIGDKRHKDATALYQGLEDTLRGSFVSIATLKDMSNECCRWMTADPVRLCAALHNELGPLWAMHRKEVGDLGRLSAVRDGVDAALKEVEAQQATLRAAASKGLSLNGAAAAACWDAVAGALGRLSQLEDERHGLVMDMDVQHHRLAQQQRTLEQQKLACEQHLARLQQDLAQLKQQGDRVETVVLQVEDAYGRLRDWNRSSGEDVAATEKELRTLHMGVVEDVAKLLVHASQATEAQIADLTTKKRDASMRRELCLEALDKAAKGHAAETRKLEEEICQRNAANTQIKQKLTTLFDHLTPTAAYFNAHNMAFAHPLTKVKNNNLLNTKIQIMEYKQLLCERNAAPCSAVLSLA